MDRDAAVRGTEVESIYGQLHELQERLGRVLAERFDRSLPFSELLFDRWERARRLGFGDGTSIYDSALVFGHPQVGARVWIGPNAVIDGSGGLEIGDYCTIAVGVQIYTHDDVARTLTSGAAPIVRSPVRIGASTYIGPNTIVRRGVEIGDHCVIGAGSYVNRAIPSYSIAAGVPARVIGRVTIAGSDVIFDYHDRRDIE